MRVFIYALCEPDTGEIRYVGSSKNPRSRLTSHLSFGSSIAIRSWVKDLGARGLEPLLAILGEADSDAEAADLEARFILQFTRPRLLNALVPLPFRPIIRQTVRAGRPLEPTEGGMLLSEAIKTLRISQNEAGRQLDVTVGMVSRFISGQRLPGRTTCVAIQRVFGIDPASWDRPDASKRESA